MWRQDPDSIQIVTDTLYTDMQGNARNFQSKCWPMPHLKLAMAGTGLASVLETWHTTLQQGMLSRDITMLNNHVPSALRQIWAHTLSNPELPPDARPTVSLYHFGVDEQTAALVRYVYRSTRNFEPEFYAEPSFAVKPAPSGGIVDQPADLNQMVQLACQLRQEQDAQPAAQRVSLGGDLVLTVINADSIITTASIFRWPDYDSLWNEMSAHVVP